MGLFNSKPANAPKPANGINTSAKNMNKGPAPVALGASNSSGSANVKPVNNLSAPKMNNKPANGGIVAQPLMGGRRRKGRRANQTRRRKSRGGRK